MSGITDDQEDIAKKLTSAALSWIANATKVIPAKGNLKTGAGFLLGGGYVGNFLEWIQCEHVLKCLI